MSCEEPRVARRSASQGSLNGSFAVPTRTGSAISDSGHHLVPNFKPLRSIREHGHTFLDPAASADGMLRKTTETGNIGLFSIKTGRPTALRPRASLGDLRQPHRPFSRNSDRPPGHDDRKRLPSYRDSTSEIISMYGSDNQSSSKSVSGTLSPPWDDSGQRSYSMTTCGSKSYTLSRSNGIQLAHDSQASAQRPRSPYPYPTRLPRPGIRPSSPALTENGLVDYSRMVEIDRIPQRTIHHPHKTLFPFKTTRDQPGPLSMRYGMNQSTRSLSDDRDPVRPFLPPMSRRPPLPHHYHPWGLRPRDRLGSGSSDQSLRTVSFSSTSGGYGNAPQQVPRLQLPEKKPPIFYDYSEDFEDAVDPPPDLPIANPTPTRISKSFCPGIPDDGCDDKSESADEGVGHVVDYLRRVTMIESGGNRDDHDQGYDLEYYRPVSQLHQRESPAQPSSDEAVDQPLASSPVLSRFPYEVASSHVSIATLDDHLSDLKECQTVGPVQATDSLNHGLVSEASTVESPLDPETPSCDMKMPLTEAACFSCEDSVPSNRHEQTNGTENNDSPNGILDPQTGSTEPATSSVLGPDLASCAFASPPYLHSSARKDSRLFSLSSGLSDLASFVNYVDKHIQTLEADTTEQYNTPIPGSMSEPRSSDHGRNRIHTIQGTPAPPRSSSLAHVRAGYTGLKVNAPAPVDELELYQVVSTRSGPTLVPQPISPAKMLRVKNSIPHLMKALPPLPGYSPASESPFNPTIVPVEFEPFDFSRLTDARSTLIEALDSESHDEEGPKGYDPFAFDRGVRKPKLKLRNATALTSDNARRPRPGHSAQADMALSETLERSSTTKGHYSTAPVKRRLPIKVARPALGSVASEDSGTVKRRLGFNNSSTVSELASLQPEDLFSTSTYLEMAVRNAGHPPSEQPCSNDQDNGTINVIDAPPVARIQRVTVIDEGRGVSLDAHLDALPSSRTKTGTATEDEMQSFFSDSFVKPRRELRKKFSNLKSRLTEPRHYQFSSTIQDGAHEAHGIKATQSDADPQAPNGRRDLLTEMSPAKRHHTVVPTHPVRIKWEKLVKGAKRRLRIWGKNRHKSE